MTCPLVINARPRSWEWRFESRGGMPVVSTHLFANRHFIAGAGLTRVLMIADRRHLLRSRPPVIPSVATDLGDWAAHHPPAQVPRYALFDAFPPPLRAQLTALRRESTTIGIRRAFLWCALGAVAALLVSTLLPMRPDEQRESS